MKCLKILRLASFFSSHTFFASLHSRRQLTLLNHFNSVGDSNNNNNVTMAPSGISFISIKFIYKHRNFHLHNHFYSNICYIHNNSTLTRVKRTSSINPSVTIDFSLSSYMDFRSPLQ